MEKGVKEKYKSAQFKTFQMFFTSNVSFRLRAMLREQLIKSGWRDSLKMECRRVVQEQGLDNISVDEIIKQVTPHARCKSFQYLLKFADG